MKNNGDKICDECGRLNVTWYTDNKIWNETIGGPDARYDPGGVLCLSCFAEKANAVGLPRVWKLVLEGGKP